MGSPGNGEESRATNPWPQYEEASGVTTLNRYFVVTGPILLVRRSIVDIHSHNSAMRKRDAVKMTQFGHVLARAKATGNCRVIHIQGC